MSRKTRRSRKERHKRLMRRITLLEQANADPKRRNRKTRLREMWNLAITDFRREGKEASRADQT
ncbi:MAG: hypothetical protein ABSH35_00750 [Isosphaeraceae bacterium]|jgi:hypothetical protein